MLLRRVVQLYVGLLLFGVSCGMLLLGTLGNAPWDVLHQGLARHTSIGTGVWGIIVSLLLLLLWIPLKVRPGLGTISNALLVGVFIQLMLNTFPDAHALGPQLALMLGGVALNGVATGMYIGAHFGPGPRDGLMTGLAARGHSVRAVRTCIEIVVLISGWLLGGRIGIGTVVYALGIGPMAQVTLPLFAPSAAPAPRGRSAPLPSRSAP